MASQRQQLVNSIQRWKLARQCTLWGVTLAALVSVAAVSSYQAAAVPDDSTSISVHRVSRMHTYSGIGIRLAQTDRGAVIKQVFPGSAADGTLFPGAVLVSVDGERPHSVRDWGRLIRGKVGTNVELEVAYAEGDCSRPAGHQTVTLERAVINVSL
ncbi:MAG: PDZ domain-containing protein [Nannocystaceae bacterium]